MLLNESKGAKSVKIFVKEDLNLTMPISTKDEEDSSEDFIVVNGSDSGEIIDFGRSEKVVARFRRLARKLVLKRMVCKVKKERQ